MGKLEEKDLLLRLRKGDVKSFEFLFRFYYEPLLAYAVRILKAEADAEEVVQDLFFKIWRDRKSLKIENSLAAYLYKSVYHQCLNRIRKDKQRQIYREYVSLQPKPELRAEERIQYEELNRKFFELLETMPPRRQTIFKLNRFQGLKYREIAEKLSISVKTVEANMSKALQYLRKHLQEDSF
jgi:RNA polymerase sigma-70 factor (ECF subfamily)